MKRNFLISISVLVLAFTIILGGYAFAADPILKVLFGGTGRNSVTKGQILIGSSTPGFYTLVASNTLPANLSITGSSKQVLFNDNGTLAGTSLTWDEDKQGFDSDLQFATTTGSTYFKVRDTLVDKTTQNHTTGGLIFGGTVLELSDGGAGYGGVLALNQIRWNYLGNGVWDNPYGTSLYGASFYDSVGNPTESGGNLYLAGGQGATDGLAGFQQATSLKTGFIDPILLTADHYFQLPDKDGIFALTDDLSSAASTTQWNNYKFEIPTAASTTQWNLIKTAMIYATTTDGGFTCASSSSACGWPSTGSSTDRTFGPALEDQEITAGICYLNSGTSLKMRIGVCGQPATYSPVFLVTTGTSTISLNYTFPQGKKRCYLAGSQVGNGDILSCGFVKEIQGAYLQ